MIVTLKTLNKRIKKEDLESFTNYLFIHRQKDTKVKKMTKVVNKKFIKGGSND